MLGSLQHANALVLSKTASHKPHAAIEKKKNAKYLTNSC